MVVKENRFHDRADAADLEELNQRVLEEKKTLQQQLSQLNRIFNMILAAAVFLGVAVLLSFTPGAPEGRPYIGVMVISLAVWLVSRRWAEKRIWSRFETLRIHYERRVAVASIHLESLPQATFAAVLTPNGGFYFCRVDQDKAVETIHACFDEAFVITPACALETSSASRMTLEEMETFLDNLAESLGVVLVVPTSFEMRQVLYFQMVERSLTSLN